MKNNKIFITVNNLKDIDRLKELGITKLVFPLKEFCVGIPNTFLVSSIPCDGYIFVNRILDNESIDKLRIILNNLPENIKGIIFDDLGIMELVKDLEIEKILYLSHFNTNSASVNIYLDLVDSVILSTDITKNEIENIINNANGKVTLFTFGYTGVMYSRRLLIDNYCEFYNLKKENPIQIENTGHKFIVYENEYGTYFYHGKVFNGLELMELDANYFINSVFLSIEQIENILNGNIDGIDSDKGFLYTETIFKLKGGNDD